LITYVGNGGTWTGTLAEYDDGVNPRLPDAGDEIRLPDGVFIVIMVDGPFTINGANTYTVRIRKA
jgi:hypothetical protein